MPWVGLERGTLALQGRRPSHSAVLISSHQVWGGINYLKLYYFAATPSRITLA